MNLPEISFSLRYKKIQTCQNFSTPQFLFTRVKRDAKSVILAFVEFFFIFGKFLKMAEKGQILVPAISQDVIDRWRPYSAGIRHLRARENDPWFDSTCCLLDRIAISKAQIIISRPNSANIMRCSRELVPDHYLYHNCCLSDWIAVSHE